MQIWQNKIRKLRQFWKGWSKNVNGTYKKKKKQMLLEKANELEKKAETTLLTQQEADLKQNIKDRLNHLLREDEIKWFQRAKTMKLLEGDRNTKYFQALANVKRRKTRIFHLEQEEGIIEGDENLRKYITNYYKGLLGPSRKSNFSMSETWRDDIPQASEEENAFLSEEFSKKEVREAIFRMKHNKALAPDGFPTEFYQVFWSLIKDDLMVMFRDFHQGSLPIYSLNFGILTLIPKLKEVKMTTI